MQRIYHLDKSALDEVPADLVASMAKAGQRRHYSDRQIVQQQGDPGDGFWIVVAGEVLVGKLDADGGITAYAVLQEGAVFGELAYFAGIERQVDVFARGAAELVWVGDRAIRALIAQNPDLAMVLLRSLARQLQTALQLIDDRRRLSIRSRLAQLLLSRASESEEARLAVFATQQELADLLGVSRVSVVSALADFAEEGLVKRGYGKLLISDPARLKRAASP